MKREQIVEAMAESAHEAWMSWYLERGITSRLAAWGEEFLVPFAALSDDGKELDRIIMRAILDALDRQGFEVVPTWGDGPCYDLCMCRRCWRGWTGFPFIWRLRERAKYILGNLWRWNC